MPTLQTVIRALAALAALVAFASACEPAPEDSGPPAFTEECRNGTGYCLSRLSGRPGTRVTASAPASGPNKAGDVIRTNRFQLWWNLAPKDWIEVVAQRTPVGAVLLAETATPLDERLKARFEIPDIDPGIYPIVQIVYGGGGATSLSYRFRVSAE